MTKKDIFEEWKSVGWNSIKDYHNSCENTHHVIKDFDPDKINPTVFWEAADEYFFTDPVSNSNKQKNPFDVKNANLINHDIAVHCGMIGQMDLAKSNVIKKFGIASIAEIGCGYGSFFENYILAFFDQKDSLFTQYTGFDVVKRFSRAVKIKGADGTFSANQLAQYKNKFNIFYSANVFQHLSPIQINKYLTQIYELLPFEGYANIMYVHNIDHTYHYGQVVEIIPEENFLDIIQTIGYKIVASTKIYSGDVQPFSVLLEK